MPSRTSVDFKDSAGNRSRFDERGEKAKNVSSAIAERDSLQRRAARRETREDVPRLADRKSRREATRSRSGITMQVELLQMGERQFRYSGRRSLSSDESYETAKGAHA